MPQAFNVIEHIIPGQHIRGYPHATRFRQEDSLQLALKQYVPRDSLDPLPEDAVTIIGAHGNGFPKASQIYVTNGHTTELNEVTGDLRTFVGRSVCPTTISRGAHTCHLDGRLLKSRCQWRGK